MTNTTLLSRFHDEVFTDPETLALAGFLAGYPGLTRTAYALDLRFYAEWLASHNIRLFDAKRAHIEAFARAVDLAIGERYEGTILYANDGGPLNRHAAARIVRRIGKAAGINKKIGPHTLRHGFITAALDAGVPLRDVQEAASHADSRTTM